MESDEDQSSDILMGPIIWAYLSNLHLVDTVEHGVQERDALDNKLLVVDVDAVTNIIGMLDEEENARTEELLSGGSEDERERKQSCSGSRNNGDEAALEERH